MGRGAVWGLERRVFGFCYTRALFFCVSNAVWCFFCKGNADGTSCVGETLPEGFLEASETEFAAFQKPLESKNILVQWRNARFFFAVARNVSNSVSARVSEPNCLFIKCIV